MQKKTKIIIAMIVVITLCLIGFLLLNPKGNSKKTAEESLNIKYHNIEGINHVFINGTVTPVRSQEFVKDTSLGKLGDLQVKNGQLVEEGTLLYQYIDPNSDREVADIQGNIQSTQADRYKAARQMELELQQLSKGGEEAEALGGNTEANRESIALKYDINGFDVRLGQMEQQLADVLERQVNKVTAPFTGKVSIPQDKTRDSAILNLTSEDYYVVGNVNEKDVAKIKVKQPAEIQLIASKATFQGNITYISEIPNVSTGAEGAGGTSSSLSNYTVKLSIAKPKDIKNGFHVQAAINIDEKNIQIPREALKYDGDQAYVLVDDFGTVLKKNLTLVKDQSPDSKEVEVANGLEAMDRLILSSDKELKDGDVIPDSEGSELTNDEVN